MSEITIRQPQGALASKLPSDFLALDLLNVIEKTNAATDAAALIVPTVASNRDRHSWLQRFVLANDSTTIAVEVPIWLGEEDIAALEDKYPITIVPKEPVACSDAGHKPRFITGHIDFLQARNGAIRILDYKPDARTNRPIAQLTIYALALTRLVPGLRLFDIKCAWFNGNCYNEFFPRKLLPQPEAPRLKGLAKRSNKRAVWSGQTDRLLKTWYNGTPGHKARVIMFGMEKEFTCQTVR